MLSQIITHACFPGHVYGELTFEMVLLDHEITSKHVLRFTSVSMKKSKIYRSRRYLLVLGGGMKPLSVVFPLPTHA